MQTVKVLEFNQIPLSPFLEGPVHALRAAVSMVEAEKIHRAVKASELYDRKLKMFKLNAPLTKESYEIGSVGGVASELTVHQKLKVPGPITVVCSQLDELATKRFPLATPATPS